MCSHFDKLVLKGCKGWDVLVGLLWPPLSNQIENARSVKEQVGDQGSKFGRGTVRGQRFAASPFGAEQICRWPVSTPVLSSPTMAFI